MKTTLLKNSPALISLLLALGLPTNSSAHEWVGMTLGKAAGATDLYQVTCGQGSDHLSVQVIDLAPAVKPVVNIQVIKGTKATNSSDQKDGDAIYSPLTETKGGTGVYYVLVNKSAVGAEIYSVEYHCETSTGGHTDTSDVQLQNQ